MYIPLVDLKEQYNRIQQEVETAVLAVLRSGRYILGEQVRAFEEEICEYLGITEAVAVGNGSDALYLSLKAYSIGSGDEVITTPFSFIATGDAIVRAGAKPVFVDIDPGTYNLDPDRIEERITPRTKAIIPVHLYGQCSEMDRIMQIAKKHSLLVIEDACQAFGAACLGRKAGTWGDVGCFSFFPTKNLGGCGDGGMIVTSNKDLADKLRMLRVHGSNTKYNHVLQGINSRLDEVQAAVLRVKLRYIDSWNRRRREIAERYRSLLKNLPLVLPQEHPDMYHTYHLYTVGTSGREERESLVMFLRKHGIETAVHYPTPIYLQPSYQSFGYQKGLCPNAEEATDRVCSIPLYPEMTDEAVQQVAETVAAFYEGRRCL